MDIIHWIPPPNGVLKINVHGESFPTPLPNGKTNGIGVVLRTSAGNLVNYIACTIPNLTTMANQLWAILVGLRRTYIEQAKYIILETDNLEAFGSVQFAHLNQHPEHADLIQQIIVRICDPTWICSLRFMYSQRNMVAH